MEMEKIALIVDWDDGTWSKILLLRYGDMVSAISESNDLSGEVVSKRLEIVSHIPKIMFVFAPSPGCDDFIDGLYVLGTDNIMRLYTKKKGKWGVLHQGNLRRAEAPESVQGIS